MVFPGGAGLGTKKGYIVDLPNKVERDRMKKRRPCRPPIFLGKVQGFLVCSCECLALFSYRLVRAEHIGIDR